MIFHFRGGTFEIGPAEVEDIRRQLIPDEEIDIEVAALEERADQEAEASDDLDEVLTLTEILARRVVPHSKSTLYRIAEDGAEGSPFYKCGGRWVATRGDLLAWVRSAPRSSDGPPPDPMPQRCRTAADVLAAIDGDGGR